MRILIWHVHGSYHTAFVQGRHQYLIPVNRERDPDGRGRARTWNWPRRALEVSTDDLGDADFDVVVLQRPHEADLVEAWTGRRPGRDVPAIYLEHNTPPSPTRAQPHPMAERGDIPVVHVTYFNRLYWDCGDAPTEVIEHGIVDPGHRYVGDWPRAAVVMNDPVRRWHALGTDLLPDLAEAAPLDVFGMGVDRLAGHFPDSRFWTFEDLPQHKMHTELARRRVYIHTSRWTSLGLSLIEAMQLGMPIVALSATEVPRAVPAEAGTVSADLASLQKAVRTYVHDPIVAAEAGHKARAYALDRYGLGRFLGDWDRVLETYA